MKRFFNLVMAVAATMILASSCNNEPINEPVPDNNVNFTATQFTGAHMGLGESGMYMVMLSDAEELHSYVFTLYNKLGEVDENGFVTIPSGTYTSSENQGDFTVYSVAMYTDYSGGTEDPKRVTFTESTVVVSDNKLVLTAVIEDVTHVVTYEGSLTMRADLPDDDVDLVVDHAYAYYTKGTSEENVDKFKLFISDLGHDQDGRVLPNGTYYRVTLSVEKLDPNATIAIPAGRYEIGGESSAVGSITDAMYYRFGDTVSESAESDLINSGYLIVNEDGSIEASFDMYFSRATHNISFTGEIEILENTIPTEAPYSTLTSDKECDLSNNSLSIWYYGDVYGVGYHSWIISIYTDNTAGDNLMIEILCGTDKQANISGNYTVSNSKQEYTALPGYFDGFTLTNSWYYYHATALDISEYAPIVSGNIDIQSNSGLYTITFDFYDDLENHITGSYTGRLL